MLSKVSTFTIFGFAEVKVPVLSVMKTSIPAILSRTSELLIRMPDLAALAIATVKVKGIETAISSAQTTRSMAKTKLILRVIRKAMIAAASEFHLA